MFKTAPAVQASSTLNPAVHQALRAVLSAGLLLDASGDLEELLLALRVTGREDAVTDLCEVRMLIAADDWMAALRLLRQLESTGRVVPLIAALQSWCLYNVRDSEWRFYARKALQTADPITTSIVQRFLEPHERAEFDLAA
ncbi:MAG: HrpB1 family type III secretion system apparatus protein [Janthinobacterium lividum]